MPIEHSADSYGANHMQYLPGLANAHQPGEPYSALRNSTEGLAVEFYLPSGWYSYMRALQVGICGHHLVQGSGRCLPLKPA